MALMDINNRRTIDKHYIYSYIHVRTFTKTEPVSLNNPTMQPCLLTKLQSPSRRPQNLLLFWLDDYLRVICFDGFPYIIAPVFSTPAFSTPAILLVSHFPLPHFMIYAFLTLHHLAFNVVDKLLPLFLNLYVYEAQRWGTPKLLCNARTNTPAAWYWLMVVPCTWRRQAPRLDESTVIGELGGLDRETDGRTDR